MAYHRERLRVLGPFELWRRLHGQTYDYFVVHIATGRYLHTDGQLHNKRQYFGALRFACRAIDKWGRDGQRETTGRDSGSR